MVGKKGRNAKQGSIGRLGRTASAELKSPIGGQERQEKERSRGMSGLGSEPRDQNRPRVRRTDAAEGRSRAEDPSHVERYEDVRFERGSRSGGSSGSATRSPHRGQQNGGEGEQSSGLYGSQVDSSNLMGSTIAELIGTFILIYTG